MKFNSEILKDLNIENKRLIARIISNVESENEISTEILKAIFNKTGNAYRIGITGPPGAGKSTITNQLTKHILSLSKSVAVIAVDPTSPYSGGALLGDRIRMNEIGTSDKVYIRSVATRGSLGGLSKKTIDIADVLDASGFDFIIFETVGVGQSELDIAKIANTTVVTLVPESGDSIQAMKAGLMEIADLFVLNKCDRPDADKAYISIQTTLQLRNFSNDSWQPLVLKTNAINNVGIPELYDSINKHRIYCIDNDSCMQKKNEYTKERVISIIESYLKKELLEKNNQILDNSISKVNTRELSPYSLAENIIKSLMKDVVN